MFINIHNVSTISIATMETVYLITSGFYYIVAVGIIITIIIIIVIIKPCLIRDDTTF